ncbi:hypothetical protein LOTGIDRAFT_163116 [Lottia gigantea]|uniref:DNA repair protein XRCC4 n=1 Tax=Lottia gigantea TaxID=225164 RepID=V3ZKB8_LOTGI|nr:hypothetical protein LOTGIDRAFT_163116 [Lottia gigantea]ESO91758.1 hypothetical protein LOTGIDRAFT_163116 [Lottia gigantea]
MASKPSLIMSKKVLSKLSVSGSKKNYFLLSTTTEDKEDGFQLILSNGESVWEGELSADEIDKQRKKLKMDFNTYYIQTEKAFTRSDEDKNYEYQIKINQDDTANLSWKKHVTNDDIKLGHVVLLLKDDVSSSVCSILEHCVKTNKLNTDRIHSLQTDNERLSQERTMALKRLEKCVAAKEEMEKDLYSKFVAVLNSKKEKLRELKENRSSEVSEEITSSPPPKPSTSRASSIRNGRSRKKKMVVKDDDEMSEEMNTDEEETPPPKRQRKAATGNNMSDGDTSLVLEDDVSTSTVVTRPARQRAGTKKATPSKPVLPKVTRNHSNESGSSMKTRMSKSSSNNSNIDAEDLFSDL